MRDLVSYGEVRRAWTGLVVQDLTPELVQHFGTKRGVVVAAVEPDSPADAAGLARGDAVTRVDGHDVTSREEFEQRVQDHREGDRLTLTRRRSSSEEDDVRLTVAAFPAARADKLAWSQLGLEVAEDGDGLAVRKVRGGSQAARIGIARGDRLLGLNGTEVGSMADFRRRVIELSGARVVLLSIGRGPYQYNIRVPLERAGG
jgi:S1-C subfamily serine protease